ncbi:hypothetical protein AYL99_11846 [Fonsecaea erecta]|uniref:Uncharacterized protein n=1 Tax=Fonsecaea erecta TaxID=1367422 RepID=A0A178Z3F1_9EURO|nr:hypothetical protein AYL99_11846 [Fonsecaea erecta]OAP53966.1 hypothetical protein AYL99_11846 [Fonsecaea erecta]
MQLRSGRRTRTLQAAQPPPASEDLPSSEYPFELQQLADFLRSHPAYDDQIKEFYLPHAQWEQLEAESALDSRFAGSLVKYDYSSATEILSLRMPSAKHDLFREFIGNSFYRFLRDPAIARYTQSLKYLDSLDIMYPSDIATQVIQRQPDMLISNWKIGRCPVLVFEVGYAEPAYKLHNRAREYIERTQGRIQTVITFNLSYPRGKRASFIVWRASFGEDGQFKKVVRGDTVVIRNGRGDMNPDPAAGLFLSLEDFGFPPGVDTGADRPGFSVSMEDLYADVRFAEEDEELDRAAYAVLIEKLGPFAKK